MPQASSYSLGTSGTALGLDSNGDVKRFSLREVLNANRTYYVSTTGNDANDGLTAGAPKTLAGALTRVGQIDFNGYSVTIQLADGTYTGTFYPPVTVGQYAPGNLVINGNSTTPSNVVVQSPGNYAAALEANTGVRFWIQNLRINASAANGYGLFAGSPASVIQIGGGVDFGANCYAHIGTRNGGTVFSGGNYSVSAAAAHHVYGEMSGLVQIYFVTITFTTTMAFTNFVSLASGAVARMDGITWTNKANVTGSRFNVGALCYLNTSGGGATYFPGDAVGTTNALGVYA